MRPRFPLTLLCIHLAGTKLGPGELRMDATTHNSPGVGLLPAKDFAIEQLLARARTGDSAAIGALLEEYRGYLTLLARTQIGRRLQGKADAADLVQEAFLQAHQHIGAFRGTSEAE